MHPPRSSASHSIIRANLGSPGYLRWLTAEAHKSESFAEFEDRFHHALRGLYWHITTDPHFFIDPQRGPRDMSSMAVGGAAAVGKLMVTGDPAAWIGYYGRKQRPWAARIDLSAVDKRDYWPVCRGFSHEVFVDNTQAAHVDAVVSVAAALAYQRRFDAALPQSTAALRAFYDSVLPRANSVLPQFYGVLSEQDILLLNQLEAQWTTYRTLAEQAYERGDHARAADYDEVAEELADRLEAAAEEVTSEELGAEDWNALFDIRAQREVEGRHPGVGERAEATQASWAYREGGVGEGVEEGLRPSLEEEFAQDYADWTQSPGACVAYPRWDSTADFISTLRGVARSYPGFVEATTDDQLLDAARDAYNIWQRRVDKYRRNPQGVVRIPSVRLTDFPTITLDVGTVLWRGEHPWNRRFHWTTDLRWFSTEQEIARSYAEPRRGGRERRRLCAYQVVRPLRLIHVESGPALMRAFGFEYRGYYDNAWLEMARWVCAKGPELFIDGWFIPNVTHGGGIGPDVMLCRPRDVIAPVGEVRCNPTATWRGSWRSKHAWKQ